MALYAIVKKYDDYFEFIALEIYQFLFQLILVERHLKTIEFIKHHNFTLYLYFSISFSFVSRFSS